MKKIVEKAVYACDICGEEIKTGPYEMELVTLKYGVLKGNGWNEWEESRERHVHKKCLGALGAALRLDN